MKILDLFAGSGGFSLGFKKAGFETAAFCEIDENCHNVLSREFPHVPIYKDIKKFNAGDIGHVDVVTGGFPCQGLSIAGLQRGIRDDDRSNLWWDMHGIIRQVRPKFAVMENVPNFLREGNGTWFGDFLGSLAEIGYDAEWKCISAADVGLPHLRERVWVVAYPIGVRLDAAIFNKISLQEYFKKQPPLPKIINSPESGWRLSWNIPEHLRMDNGVPLGLDEIKARVKMMGNAIVPEIAYLIAKEIRKFLEEI